MAVEDTQEEREKRAARLRKQIEDMKKGTSFDPNETQSPRDFINEKMREEEERKKESDLSDLEEEKNERSDDCEQ